MTIGLEIGLFGRSVSMTGRLVVRPESTIGANRERRKYNQNGFGRQQISGERPRWTWLSATTKNESKTTMTNTTLCDQNRWTMTNTGKLYGQCGWRLACGHNQISNCDWKETTTGQMTTPEKDQNWTNNNDGNRPQRDDEQLLWIDRNDPNVDKRQGREKATNEQITMTGKKARNGRWQWRLLENRNDPVWTQRLNQFWQRQQIMAKTDGQVVHELSWVGRWRLST